MTTLNTILLQSQGGGWSGMLMIVAMIVIFYFFMIRPQSQKQKQIKKSREAMQAGDKVVSAGGIHGKIKSIDHAAGTLVVEIAPGVQITMDIASIYPAGQQENAEKK
ncbi:MAG: preprotein translocase subunit YajC [Muribaculaceae bacterium]|nr:preprotein translocase subunit YajC [Muribaculaceae bacterium]